MRVNDEYRHLEVSTGYVLSHCIMLQWKKYGWMKLHNNICDNERKLIYKTAYAILRRLACEFSRKIDYSINVK